MSTVMLSPYTLSQARSRIWIPVVLSAMSNQNAAHHLNPLDPIASFHATSSSATLRAVGMCPRDKSVYKTRRRKAVHSRALG